MTKKDLTKKQKMIARLQEFTLMDDDFMTRFFENDKECTQFVLQTILDNKKLKVIDTEIQKVVKNLEGRSVRLDVFAKDNKGKPYDIEIQRSDKGAGAKRARYNSALMDADITEPGDDPIGDLMHDFHCKKADDMKNKILADRTRYLKESDKGVKHMCRIMEDFAKEERKDERNETTIEMAAKLLESGKMSEDEITELYKLTAKQMKAIKERVAVLA